MKDKDTEIDKSDAVYDIFEYGQIKVKDVFVERKIPTNYYGCRICWDTKDDIRLFNNSGNSCMFLYICCVFRDICR